MWLVFSFLYSFFDSIQNTYFKHTAVKISPILMAWSVLIVSSLCFSPLLLLGIPSLDFVFWLAVGTRLIIDSIAFVLFIKGVQISPLSLTIPMTSLSPILSIATVFVFSRLLPSPLGFFGVLISVAGMYLLHFDHDTKHLLSPFYAIKKEKGVLFVTVASILWSVVAALQKLSIDHSDVYFYTAFFQLFWAICFTPVAYFSNKKGFLALFQRKSWKILLTGGTLDAIKMLLHNLAYALTIPAYVNSIGNTSILLSSVFGAILFKEKIKNHFWPIILIILGITCILFG